MRNLKEIRPAFIQSEVGSFLWSMRKGDIKVSNLRKQILLCTKIIKGMCISKTTKFDSVIFESCEQ